MAKKSNSTKDYVFYQDASGNQLVIKANSTKDAWSKLTKKVGGNYIATSFELLKSNSKQIAKKSKTKNPVTNTARSAKKYKLVLIKSASNIAKKYTNSTKDVNTFITKARKTSRSLKWSLYTYRPSIKSYRLSKKSSNS